MGLGFFEHYILLWIRIQPKPRVPETILSQCRVCHEGVPPEL